MTKQEKAEKDYMAGMKYKDIASKYEVSINTVKSWKKRHGWSRDKPKRKGVHPKDKKVAPKKEIPAVDELLEDTDLTDKQKEFCIYYLQRYNATWAYQKAYGAPYKTAMTSASRLLRNDKIKAHLTELKKQQAQDLYLTANDILLRYVHQATSNVTDVLSFRTEKHLVYYKIRDKDGPYEDGGGKFRYEPKINPETGEQDFYYEHIVELKDSENIDTSNIKSIRIDKGEPVVEMEDKQKAMQILLDRLPEPEINDDSSNSLLNAIGNGLKKIWSEKDDKDK